MVGDGSYLMMAQELVDRRRRRAIKLTVVLVQNHGFASIGALSESLGSQRFGTRYRYRNPDTGALDGDLLPVDLAANAASLGADVAARARRSPSSRRRCATRAASPTARRSCTSRPTRSSARRTPRRGGTCPSPRCPSSTSTRAARSELRAPQAHPADLPEHARESGDPVSTTALKTIQHRIAGRETPGASTRTAPVCDPATGEQQAEVLLAEAADVDAAVQAAREAFETLGRRLAHAPRARDVRVPRPRRASTSTSSRGSSPSEHGKVLRRREGRGDPRAGGRRVRVRHCRSCSRASSPTRSRPDVDALLVPPAARRLRRHHAVQLPGDGPDVDAPDGDRVAATRSCSSRPSATRRRRTSSPSSTPRPACPTASSTSSHGDKVAVDALLDHPDVAAVSFVGSTPIARYVHERATAAGKRVQALGGAKNHAVVLPDADLDFAADQLTAAGYGSAGQRCMAISVVVAVGDAADPLVERLARGRSPSRSARARPGLGDGAGRHAEARERIVGYIEQGVDAGAHAGRRRPRPAGRRRRLLRRADAVRRGHARHGDLPRRDLRPGARRRAGRHARRGDRADQRQPVRQRHRDLHRLAARPRAPSSARSRSA